MAPLSNSDYQVGIVCALSIEMAAVMAILDEEHQRLEAQAAGDGNCYIVGQIHNHNVVIACLPSGDYGTNSAAGVAKDMLRTFSSIRVGLMVGIGGGIPMLPESDIRLGDVVVSQPDKTYGGVVQYDLGKQLPDDSFELKGLLNKPPTLLLTALSALQACHQLQPSRVPTYIKEAYSKSPRLIENGYGCPGLEMDHLHCTQCDQQQQRQNHPCDLCSNGRITRAYRRSQDPVLHYGTIASGNSLIKSASLRDRLGQKYGALCVEMEAAGLMNDFQCVVVRGICDYADSHKNNEWQKYAALTAAAFAKELLFYLVPADVSREAPLSGIIDALKDQVSIARESLQEVIRYNDVSETRYRNDQQRSCHQCLKTSTYERFKNLNPSRAEGTCQWVFSSLIFHRWKDSLHNDLLWISADPGCGKSVLSKSLVDTELAEGNNLRVCYFFFKDNEEQDSLSTALCALLHQLFSFEPALIRHAVPAYEKDGIKLVTEVDELWRILEKVTNDPMALKITCILDALDECRDSDRRKLIQYLKSFHSRENISLSSTSSQSRGYLKFLVTSRPYDDIQDEFQLPPDLPSIRLRGEDENDKINKEIDIVIRNRINDLASSLGLNHRTRNKLEAQLLAMKHRTYLWLHLAIDHIRETLHDSLRPDEEVFDRLPSSVEDAYEKILGKVKSKKKNDVRTILQIIVGAKRALTIGEMAIALGIATSSKPKTLRESRLDERRLPEKIRNSCGLFVFVNQSKLYLIHQTAKEFLLRSTDSHVSANTWKHCLDPAEIEDLMVYICVKFLFLEDVEAIGQQLAHKVRKSKHYSSLTRLIDATDHVECLLVYVAEHWPAHLRSISSRTRRISFSEVMELYDSQSALFHWWYSIFHKAFVRGWRELTPLYMAAANGHANIFDQLLRNEGDKIALEKHNVEALHLAIRFGHQKFVEMLLDRGVNVDAPAEDTSPPLAEACFWGRRDMVELLLNRGANVNARVQDCSNALQESSGRKYWDIVELLVSRGANVNEYGGRDGPSLTAAAFHGHLETVKLLLSHGADIDAGNPSYGTPINAALFKGHQDVVKLLVSRGANVNAIRGDMESPLEVASSRGPRGIDLVELLLNQGADVNALAEDGSNALSKASFSGCRELVELLLSHGANVNIQGGHYGTALQAASFAGHTEIVDLLLSHGADICLQVGRYGSPIQAASRQGKQQIVELLLSRGADINARGGTNGNALQAALAERHWSVAKVLLSSGADVNARVGKHPVALQIAMAFVRGGSTRPVSEVEEVRSKGKAMIELLLKHGADRGLVEEVEAQDDTEWPHQLTDWIQE